MFDHNKYKLSKKGVENYFWPVDRSDMTSLMNSIIAETTGYFIKLNKENANSEFNDFRITNLYFILKMLNLSIKITQDIPFLSPKNFSQKEQFRDGQCKILQSILSIFQ